MSIVIPRSVWQPRHDNGVAVIGTGEWLAAGKELWLHHSITNPFGPNATLEQDCQHMRDFEAIGEARFGAGISYTWVVMPSGRVFQGHDIDRQGTHTYQRNNRSRAICLAGNYDVNALPSRMINAVALLLRELGATLDGGHRDVYATACPGRFAYPRIGEINNLAVSGQPIEGDDDVSAAEVWGHQLGLVQPDGSEVPRQAGDILRYSELADAITRGIAKDARDIARRVEVKVDALTDALTDDEADILAEIRNLPTGPGGGASVEQIKEGLRSIFADAGDNSEEN